MGGGVGKSLCLPMASSMWKYFLSWLVLSHSMHHSQGGIYRRRSELLPEFTAIYLQLQHLDLFILQSMPGLSAIPVEIQPWVNHFLESVSLYCYNGDACLALSLARAYHTWFAVYENLALQGTPRPFELLPEKKICKGDKITGKMCVDLLWGMRLIPPCMGLIGF